MRLRQGDAEETRELLEPLVLGVPKPGAASDEWYFFGGRLLLEASDELDDESAAVALREQLGLD